MRGIKHPLKYRAVDLRKQGLSIGKIEAMLQIRRSTLSGWFRDIVLSQEQRAYLLQSGKDAFVKARLKAALWHREQKRQRIEQAKKEAVAALETINLSDKSVVEIAMATLYLGEGFKTVQGLGIGNSNPMILQFFIAALAICYDFDKTKIKCELHLRADQNPMEIKAYWAQTLGLPLENFKTVSIDQRTRGSPTYSSYKGVCALRCASTAIQRRLLHLGALYCEKIIANTRA
ncbi:MAG: hypothetical protein AAB916_01860 [Patescibacteria group bacterium]